MSHRQPSSSALYYAKYILLLLFLSKVSFAFEPSERSSLSNQVQQLLTVDSEKLGSDTVENLYTNIMKSRHEYSKNVIAKVLLLSARVASNQGDINKVLLLSKKGLSVHAIDKATNLSLLLQLAEVYVAKKKYAQLLELSQRAVKESELNTNVKYSLLSLSYRSVAFSMLGKHQQALEDLQVVEKGLGTSVLTEHIKLLTIIALAYHHLGDYQTSLTVQLNILKLRFKLRKKNNIDQTYLYLAYAYFYLERFDDAYNAFWESKEAAKIKGTPINIAHADKGLGITLLSQKNYQKSSSYLLNANRIFKKYKIASEEIETSVALVKAKLAVGETSEGYNILLDVINLLDGKNIPLEYLGFYRLVAEMYFAEKNYQKAYYWQTKNSKALLQNFQSTKKSYNTVNSFPQLNEGGSIKHVPVEQSKKLAVKLAENSELSSVFVDKFQMQRNIIIILSVIVLLSLVILIGFFIRCKLQKINLAYEDVERNSNTTNNPAQTKYYYQVAFKKARTYQYTLSIGYLVINNWQELLFRFNSKTIDELMRDIAIIINQQLGEFDYVGLLSGGEYLVLFEHQNKQEVRDKLDKLVQAINASAFASLGDVSVTAKYSLHTPSFQDIDPYIFLASIGESINKENDNNTNPA